MEKLQLTENRRSKSNGRFLPGVSGNPDGRPKSSYAIAELAKQHTEKALKTLVSIAGDPSAPPAARVSAAECLLNRAWGRPVQAVETTIAVSFPQFLESLAVQTTTPTIISVEDNAP